MAKVTRTRLYFTGDPEKDATQTLICGDLAKAEKYFNTVYKSRPASFTHVRSDVEFKLEDIAGVNWIYNLVLTPEEAAEYADIDE